MYLEEEVTGVTAQGYEYPQAYVTRSLAPGIGSENYDWGSFKTFKTPAQLDEDNQALGDQIAQLETVPLGVVQMWAGNVGKIPTDRYRLATAARCPWRSTRNCMPCWETCTAACPVRPSVCPISGDDSSSGITPTITIITP